MTIPCLMFEGKNTVIFKDKRSEVSLNSTIESKALLDELAFRRDRVVEARDEETATEVTGLDNGCVHHYKSGKSTAVKVKTVLKHLDATGTQPADLPGLPNSWVEKFNQLLLNIEWQPVPEKNRRFKELTEESNLLVVRSINIRRSIEVDSLRSYWLQLTHNQRIQAVSEAEDYFSEMQLALEAKHFDVAHIYHVRGHNALIDPEFHLLVSGALEISTKIHEDYTSQQPLNEYIHETVASHNELTKMYLSWDKPSKFDEAMYFLDVRYRRILKLLRSLTS